MTTSVPARTWARSVATLVAAASFSEMWITCLAITRLYTAISPALLRTAGIEGAHHHGCGAVDLHSDGDCSNPFAPTISFRTSNLQTQIYSLSAWCRTRRSMVQIESLRSDSTISLSLIDLHCDCLMFGNRWKLSNLSNTCLTTSPTDKESGYSEVRSG